MEINPSYFGVMCMLFGASLSFFFYRALQKSDYTRITTMINSLKDEYLLTVTNSLQENRHLHQQIRNQSSQKQASDLSMQDVEETIIDLKKDLIRVKQNSELVGQNLLEHLQHCYTQEIEQLNDQFKQGFLSSKPVLFDMLNDKTQDLPLPQVVKEHLHTELAEALTYALHSMHRYQVQLFLECNHKNIEACSPNIQDKLMETTHEITYLINKLDNLSLLNKDISETDVSSQVTKPI